MLKFHDTKKENSLHKKENHYNPPLTFFFRIKFFNRERNQHSNRQTSIFPDFNRFN